MEYLYLFSIVFFILGFLCKRKSDKELNFIKWICISLVSLYAYNVTVCMILGILHIVQNLWILSIINLIIGSILWFKVVTKYECQKYRCSKLTAISLLIMLIIFGIMFVKDLYVYKGDVTHYVIDSAIHYRAAKHYSDNLQLFVFTEDKTFFDFNIMQTGAYINDGLFMRTMKGITGLDEIYSYQLFDVMTLFACGLAFYAFFIDRIKTKRGMVGSLALLSLYMYGYPYNSWIYGFSYLTVGIAMTTLMLIVVEMLFSEENISKIIVIPMIVLSGIGIIFSYCLFVPAVFASVCIYVFLNELQDKNIKKYFKVFGRNTLIITGTLLLVTAFGIGYLFIPSFIIEGQKNLISALQENGGIYLEKYRNFIAYIPFGIIYLVELIRRIKNKELKYLDLFSCLMGGYLVLFYLGMVLGKVSPYYLIKLYFIIWLVLFAVVVDILNNNIDKKMFRLDIIILVALFVLLLVKGVYSQKFRDYPDLDMIYLDLFKVYIAIVLTFYTCLPEIVKNIDFKFLRVIPEKIIQIQETKVTPFVYVIAVFCFMTGYTSLKADHIIGEWEKHMLPNLVGMYYDEGCEYRKALDVNSNFNVNNILVTKYARENLEDMTADNTIIIAPLLPQRYWQMWTIATLEFKSDTLTFREVLKSNPPEDMNDILSDENIKYIVRVDSRDENLMKESKKQAEELNEKDNVEVLYQNENGYVAKIR